MLIPAVQWAAHIWQLESVNSKRDGRYWTVPLAKYLNGGDTPPVAGDCFIYKSTPGQRVGHIAVVVEVLGNSVRVAEQNQENDKLWEGHYADELPMLVGTGDGGKATYTVTNSDEDLELQGWIRLREDLESPREEWVRPSPVVPMDGVYDAEVCKLVQRLCGGFADGDHGGLTSSNLRTFLNCHGRPEHVTKSKTPEDLIVCLRCPSSPLPSHPSSPQRPIGPTPLCVGSICAAVAAGTSS